MMHNKQPYSFEKTDVRGRFLLNFSCTKVQSKDVSPIAGNVKLSEMITRTRYDSQLLDKHLDKTNLVMDALYEIFPLINEINDKLIELSVEQLKEILAMVEKYEASE